MAKKSNKRTSTEASGNSNTNDKKKEPVQKPEQTEDTQEQTHSVATGKKRKRGNDNDVIEEQEALSQSPLKKKVSNDIDLQPENSKTGEGKAQI
jgi:hypothetical protein